MIFDSINNIERYKNDGKLYPELLKIKALREGAEDTGLSLNEKVTKLLKDARLETHEKYIDIQFVTEGEELVLIDSVGGLNALEEYDETKDIAFYPLTDTYTSVRLKDGWFAVIYPGEGHAPEVSVKTDGHGRSVKGVIKVKA